MGQPEQARLWHERALAAYPESARCSHVHYYHHLADFYSGVLEDGPEAVKWARKDAELRWNFSTQAALAWACYRDGRFTEALVPSGPKPGQLITRDLRGAN
jgi:hypothetical protein